MICWIFNVQMYKSGSKSWKYFRSPEFRWNRYFLQKPWTKYFSGKISSRCLFPQDQWEYIQTHCRIVSSSPVIPLLCLQMRMKLRVSSTSRVAFFPILWQNCWKWTGEFCYFERRRLDPYCCSYPGSDVYVSTACSGNREIQSVDAKYIIHWSAYQLFFSESQMAGELFSLGERIIHRINQFMILKKMIFSIGKIENYNPAFVTHYPTLINPEKLKIGTSLCKLGYPFYDVKASFNESNNSFCIRSVNLSHSAFPDWRNFYTNIHAGKSADGKYDVQFIETSSPGLRGQSGGPIFDVDGEYLGDPKPDTTSSFVGFLRKLKKGIRR